MKQQPSSTGVMRWTKNISIRVKTTIVYFFYVYTKNSTRPNWPGHRQLTIIRCESSSSKLNFSSNAVASHHIRVHPAGDPYTMNFFYRSFCLFHFGSKHRTDQLNVHLLGTNQLGQLDQFLVDLTATRFSQMLQVIVFFFLMHWTQPVVALCTFPSQSVQRRRRPT